MELSSKSERRNFLHIIIILLCAAWLVHSFRAQALEDERGNPFVGAWELVALETINADGTLVPLLLTGGAEFVGNIMYTASGMMSVQIYISDRQNVSFSATFVNGYMAYYGTYEVNFEDGLVTHNRQGHILPSRNTQSVVRSFQFEDDLLYLTPVSDVQNLRLTWKHIN
jgi:hypothetical protein